MKDKRTNKQTINIYTYIRALTRDLNSNEDGLQENYFIEFNVIK